LLASSISNRPPNCRRPKKKSIGEKCGLKRLRTDYIDLYQFHDGDFPAEDAAGVRETLEELVREGKIRSYGWSTDVQKSVEVFAQGKHCSSAQIKLNIFGGNTGLLEYCESHDLAVLCRSPLAMGLLSDKYHTNSRITGEDIRATDEGWMTSFKNGKPSAELIKRRDAVIEILRSGGRNTVQGAIAWIWGKSGAAVPIPGFKNTQQVLDHARAMDLGPLTHNQVLEVERAGLIRAAIANRVTDSRAALVSVCTISPIRGLPNLTNKVP
jgi:aryl-alcohol dehydrogenase-like predicted oxidoreductase